MTYFYQSVFIATCLGLSQGCAASPSTAAPQIAANMQGQIARAALDIAAKMQSQISLAGFPNTALFSLMVATDSTEEGAHR